jgi:hypothetical protein
MKDDAIFLHDAFVKAEARTFAVYEHCKEHPDARRSGVFALGR